MATMDRFLERQPILTGRQSIFAYEILSRFGPEDYCRMPVGEAANVAAIDELFVWGLKQIAMGLPAFVNCTREFLVRDYLELLPRESVVGEILETVEPDEDVLAACRRLKRKGYRLALDDYEDGPEMEPFFELVDFVKIDFLLTPPHGRKRLGQKFQRLGIPLVAEKVETLDQFHSALAMGYQYFQGYFFCRPQTLSRRGVPRNRVTYLRILQMFGSSRIDLEEVAGLIQQEVSLSYRLLRYLNSPVFPVVGEVKSIPQALSLLGESMSRKWLGVACIASMADDKPGELVKLSLSRASFCELLAQPLGLLGAANELFLMGMLSVMDALLDLPMAEILEKLPLDSRIKDALVGQPSDYSPILDIVLQYESERLAATSCALGFDQTVVPDLYLRSVEWADSILSTTLETSRR